MSEQIARNVDSQKQLLSRSIADCARLSDELKKSIQSNFPKAQNYPVINQQLIEELQEISQKISSWTTSTWGVMIPTQPGTPEPIINGTETINHQNGIIYLNVRKKATIRIKDGYQISKLIGRDMTGAEQDVRHENTSFTWPDNTVIVELTVVQGAEDHKALDELVKELQELEKKYGSDSAFSWELEDNKSILNKLDKLYISLTDNPNLKKYQTTHEDAYTALRIIKIAQTRDPVSLERLSNYTLRQLVSLFTGLITTMKSENNV